LFPANSRRIHGFTVLEIIVVLAIIFLMMTLLVGAFVQHRRKTPVEVYTPAESERFIDPANPYAATPAPAAGPRPALRGQIPTPPSVGEDKVTR